jgi:hypothetical protein
MKSAQMNFDFLKKFIFSSRFWVYLSLKSQGLCKRALPAKNLTANERE